MNTNPLALIRKYHNVSQSAIDRELGTSNIVSALENGKCGVMLKHLKAYAKVLKIQVSDIVIFMEFVEKFKEDNNVRYTNTHHVGLNICAWFQDVYTRENSRNKEPAGLFASD